MSPCRSGPSASRSTLSRGGTATNCAARVEDLTFLGDHLRVRVAACARDDFIVKIPNVLGHGGLLEGDAVRIGWTASDCRALNHEGGDE